MLAASFLGGAKSRLLPASIPFRYFSAAAFFHVLAWGALLIAADRLAGFTGGPGMVLAAIHLLTLGVLVMTAMGAAFQLLPVATRRPLARGPTGLCFWLLAPGTLALAHGMASLGRGVGAEPAMLAGGITVTAALAGFALVVGDNLRRAGDMPVVAAHGWAALLALVGFSALGLALAADFTTGFLPDHQAAALTHLVLAGFGFMGLLVFGFSHVLVPMFALSQVLPARLGWSQFWLASAACAVGGIAAWIASPVALAAASLIGLGAAAAYLWLMRAALRTGMRKRLGLSFLVIKLSWAMLVLCLLLGLAMAMGAPIPNGETLFGFVLLVGWLLTFLTGILQRIMPFLASMHTAGADGKPVLLSDLTADLPLRLHAACHFAALLLCSAGIVTDWTLLTRLGSAAGLAGALSFAAFAFLIVIRLRRAPA